METQQLVRTMCPMNCHPALCGMLAELENGRPVKIRGDRENPDSRGYLCVRGRSALEVFDNPDRIRHPLARTDRKGPWRRIDWDEALDLMTGHMETAGRESVGVWAGHGVLSTNYGTRIGPQFLRRFTNFYSCQHWNPTMICWGFGAFGLGITGILETHSQEDMASHADLIVLWGANIASQPTLARHLKKARNRGARIITVDIRHTEAATLSDEVYLLRPGTDAALALALMHVIIAEGLYDRDFVEKHTLGFEDLTDHLKDCSPAWAAGVTSIPEDRIIDFARQYGTTRPAMIAIGGSSIYKGANGWQASRAVSCLPPLTGNMGIPGGGFGPRHGSTTHGQFLGNIMAEEKRVAGSYIPNQMSHIVSALKDGRVRNMFFFGSNTLSSFSDTEELGRGLDRADLVVSYDLFMNDTARRHADIILPATYWLEQLGCKMTHSHLYLMEQAVKPSGEARPLSWVLAALAVRLNLDGFFPWDSEEEAIDEILDHPSTGHATVASLRKEGGFRPMQVSHVAYPDARFHTPSGKVEFFSTRARELGLPPLPVYEELPPSPYPLVFRQGRTFSHFHSFYDHGQALPTLARIDSEPRLWIAPADAADRDIHHGAWIRIHNERGSFRARAHITDKIPAGTVWMRDGWEGINRLTSGCAVLPDKAVDLFPFAAGQSAFDAVVEVTPL